MTAKLRPHRVLAETVSVPMRDGTCLVADVTRADDHERRPTLLLRTPYSRLSLNDAVTQARNGWVVVIQDVRGRFDSEGSFSPFHQEVDDGVDTVAWCAAQRWSDGSVVAWGGSYVGATQLLCAAGAPPALRAIAPMCTSGSYGEGWTYEGGALQLGFVEPWAAGFVATDPRVSPARRRWVAPLVDDPQSTFRQPLGRRRIQRLFADFDGWLDGPDAPAWSAVDLARRHCAVTVPGFHVGGWYDIFCEGTLRTYTGLRDHAATERARRGQRLVVGPWTHFNLFGRMSSEMDFGPQANGTALVGEMLDWARRAAKGEEVEGGVRVFVMGANRWRDLEHWPPPGVVATRLYLDSHGHANSLRGDGTLRWEVPADNVADRVRYDPDDPVPSRGGRTCGPHLPAPGPVDQRPVEERDDVLVYTSEPLSAPLTVIGTVSATVHLASTAPSADVCAKLVDVWPDGRAFNVVDSVRRTAVGVGSVVEVVVTLGSTAITLPAGHRVRLEVSSSNFPRFDRNPSTGEPAGRATVLRPARQTVLHGATYPSFVELPVVV